MRLDPAAAIAGYRLETHETLSSTNVQALDHARVHPLATEPLWIVAGRQTAGRGRRGNEWFSPPGNLYATLLLRNPAEPRVAPQLSFVAALAVHDAILDRVPSLRGKLALKWPNDLLCEGKKVAGILIEAHNADAGLAVAIGIGVNCLNHPALQDDPAAYPATDLRAADADIAAEDLFLSLSRTMLARIEQWRGGDDFPLVRADWLGRAIGLGGEMRVRLPNRTLVGRWVALDQSGCLLLRLADGTLEQIAAGEVFPVTPYEAFSIREMWSDAAN
jgi:BirA family transcriptional regulator, biotin operon repressor / biotin---[acetyl-CoA-carboxylase] ligase